MWKFESMIDSNKFKDPPKNSPFICLIYLSFFFWDNSTSIDSTCKFSPATGFQVLIVEEQLAQQLRKSGLDVGAKAIPDTPTQGETLVEAVCTCTQYEVRFQDTQLYYMGQI